MAELQEQIQTVAQKILQAEVEPLEGCVEMLRLVNRLDPLVAEHPAFEVIVAIESDGDRFAVGAERLLWSRDALADIDRERDAFLARALPDLVAACREIAEGVPWNAAWRVRTDWESG